ncbi:MAG: MATE family efflux transporter [Christensenellales bacterium]
MTEIKAGRASKLPDRDHYKRQHRDIEEATPRQRTGVILALTWPALAEALLGSLASIVDMMMVSGLGTHAVSAVGLVTQPKFILMAVFLAMNVGTTALVARFRGADDRKSANIVLRQTIFLCIVLSVVICGIMLAVNKPLIAWIAGPEMSKDTLQLGMDYFAIQLYGFPLVALTMGINAILRGSGNTRTAFFTNTLANIVNVFFNYCLIGGNLGFPAWGVAGASLATVIGQGAGFVLALMAILRGNDFLRLDFRTRFRIDWSMIKRILRIGSPAMVEQLIMRVGMMIYTMTITRLGDNSYAAHIIANNIQSLSFTVGQGFGTASTTLVGQCLGRKRPDLAEAYVIRTRALCLIVSTTVGAVLIFLGGPMARMYTADTEVIHLAATVLMIVGVMQPLQSGQMVLSSGLRGAGDTLSTAISICVGILIIRPALSQVAINVFDMGLVGAWLAFVIDQSFRYFFCLFRFRSEKWKHIRV